MPRSALTLLLLFALAPAADALEPPAILPRSVAPSDAAVYFLAPVDGARVASPFTVVFGLRGMGVAPAGVELEHTGHHHLLVDVAKLPAADQPVPRDARHLHFGDGQTETTLTLPRGRHTLQLMLGDYLHRPHQPPVVSEKITITVE